MVDLRKAFELGFEVGEEVQSQGLCCLPAESWSQAPGLNSGRYRRICCVSLGAIHVAAFWRRRRVPQRDWVELSKALKRPHVLATTRQPRGPFGRYGAGKGGKMKSWMGWGGRAAAKAQKPLNPGVNGIGM